MNIETLRINPDQSSIFLIDESLCVSKSLDVLNTGLSALSGLTVSVKSQLSTWQDLYHTFQANSAVWIKEFTWFANFKPKWDQTHTSIQTLSGTTWTQKPINIWCPTFQNITNWNAAPTSIYQQIIDGWLNSQYPANTFAENQIIQITFWCYQDIRYQVNYSNKYLETCSRYTMVPLEFKTCFDITQVNNVYGIYFSNKCIGVGVPNCNFKNAITGDGGYTWPVTALCPTVQNTGTGWNQAIADINCKPADSKLISMSYINNNPVETIFWDFYVERVLVASKTFKVQRVGSNQNWTLV